MELINIDNIAHPLYDSFSKLYSTAFPIFEQRTETQQTRAFSHPKYHLSGYKEEDIFIGFISYWDFQEYIYIRTFRNRPTAKRIGLRKPDSERFHIPKIQNRITGNRPDYRRHFPIPFTILPEMRILRKSVSAHPPSLSRGIHRA